MYATRRYKTIIKCTKTVLFGGQNEWPLFYFSIFRKKNIVWTKGYQSTKMLIACYTEKGRILKELSLVNVHCMFQNKPVFHELAVLLAAATLCRPHVHHVHGMWFSRNHKLHTENCFYSLKKSKKCHKIYKKYF